MDTKHTAVIIFIQYFNKEHILMARDNKLLNLKKGLKSIECVINYA